MITKYPETYLGVLEEHYGEEEEDGARRSLGVSERGNESKNR